LAEVNVSNVNVGSAM